MASVLDGPPTAAYEPPSNVMRHQYKALSDAEKANMGTIKDRGLALWAFIDSMGASRELSLAKTKAEEAVMWAVKHITG